MTATRIEVAGADGTRATALCYDADAGAPVVLFMPAMGVEADYYARFAEALQAAGMNVVIQELRGIGSSTVRAARGSDFGYRELIELDWPAAIAVTRERHPGSRLVMMGHSLGGQITCLQQARAHPSQRADAIVMVACCSAHHRGYPFPKSLGIRASTQLAHAIASTAGFFPGHRLGFGGRQGRRVIADWAREARRGYYDVSGDPSDYTRLLAKLDTPALSVSFEGDGFAPAQTVDALCARLAPGAVERWHVTASELELQHVDHFRWVRGAASLAPRLASWIDTTVA